jgi:hypothetical protein
MQRRAAAVSVAFFLVVSAASYALIATAEEPTVDFEDPEYSLQQGESVTLDDQEYTVTSIEASTESSGGDHGGGGETLVRSGEVSWTIESASYTESLGNGSTVTIDNVTYAVVIDSGDDPSGFTLREELDRGAILQNDPDANNETYTDEQGNEFVVLQRDGEEELVPVDEYFEPEERSYEVGDQLTYEGQAQPVTVDEVTADAVTVAWTAPRENTQSLNHLENVTINDQTYLVFFPNNDTVYLTQQFEAYEQQTAQIDQHHRHVNGLWGVNILSGLAAFAMLGLAYLPSRY